MSEKRKLVRNRYSVSAGQMLAEVGGRGQSTGPHLHFEDWSAGERKTDPLRWLRGLGGRVEPGG